MRTLKELFLDELADVYDAECRIVKALPKVAKAATCENLKGAVNSHTEETKGHVLKLQQVFTAFQTKTKGKTCEATVGLLKETAEVTVDFKGSPAINAALICALQKVEHYEMASYGCLHEWAGVLGNKKAAALLKSILDEEKGADDALTLLARASSNEEALGGVKQGHPQTVSATKPAKPAKSKARPLEIVVTSKGLKLREELV